jgi:hypothetical protein
MTVRKRPDGRWQIDFVVHRGGERLRVKKAAKGAKTRAEALAMERAERARVETIGTAAIRPPTFEAFAGEVLATYAKGFV